MQVPSRAMLTVFRAIPRTLGDVALVDRQEVR
jgi:hypothetical protein